MHTGEIYLSLWLAKGIFYNRNAALNGGGKTAGD